MASTNHHDVIVDKHWNVSMINLLPFSQSFHDRQCEPYIGAIITDMKLYRAMNTNDGKIYQTYNNKRIHAMF